MKKAVFVFFLIIYVFLFGIDKIHALTGPYTYDINKVEIVNSGQANEALRIEGWAYHTEDSGVNHNVGPTYTLTIKAITAN